MFREVISGERRAHLACEAPCTRARSALLASVASALRAVGGPLFRNALLLLALATSALVAQPARKAVSADSVPAAIAQAELDGGRHPHPSLSDSATALFLSIARNGTSDRKCVDAGASFDVRSGEFVVRGISLYRSLWHQGNSKLGWVPAYASWSSPIPLTVRAARLDGSNDQVVFQQTNLAHLRASTSDLIYPSGFPLPSVGRWLLVATAGPNWGCFVFTLS